MNRAEYEKQLLLHKIDVQRKATREQWRKARSNALPVSALGQWGKDVAQIAGPASRIASRLAGDNPKRRRLWIWAIAGVVVGLPTFLTVRSRRR